MLYTLYRGLTSLAGPLVPVVLERRRVAGKEDPARRDERLGLAGRPRPPGRLVWVHGASVGEALSVQELIRRLLALDSRLHVLMTTGTVTSARMMADRLPGRAFHQFVPLDRISYARRFLDHWRPDLVLWIESELWPNLLTEIGRRGIAAAMVNARMSARSFARWRHAPATIRRLIGVFRVILPWDHHEAEKLRTLGAQSVGPAGNLKYSSAPLAADEMALAALRQAAGDRPVWLAASTHDGEEALCLDAHRALAAELPGLLTVIAPRHPQRGAAIGARLDEAGLPWACRSAGALPDAGTAVYLADTLGEMGVLLRLAPVVLVGGSLVPHGGHNPIEPAQLGAAILFGPHMTNFPEIAEELQAAKGALGVADGPALTATLGRLLRDPAERARMAEAAAGVAARHRGVLDTTLQSLAPLLSGLGPDSGQAA